MCIYIYINLTPAMAVHRREANWWQLSIRPGDRFVSFRRSISSCRPGRKNGSPTHYTGPWTRSNHGSHTGAWSQHLQARSPISYWVIISTLSVARPCWLDNRAWAIWRIDVPYNSMLGRSGTVACGDVIRTARRHMLCRLILSNDILH